MKKAMLIILDGWGCGKDYPGNAVMLAKTPVFDNLIKTYPHTTLSASGLSVGLPEGQMGNSEVGHLNIGSGRIIYQELTKISKAINDGVFFTNPALVESVEHAKKAGKSLHLMGLVSDGGVHSHNTHLYALLNLCKLHDFHDVYIHAFLDGRDVAPTIGATHIQELVDEIEEIGVGKIATITGRYYAMDRDKRWDRTEKAYNAIVLGEGKFSVDPVGAVRESYDDGVTDEFVLPIVLTEDDKPVKMLDDGDSVLFFNFRPDRGRQLSHAITDTIFEGFERKKVLENLHYTTMTEYDKTLKGVNIAYPPETYENTLGYYISLKGYRQLRIAETEKYAHVTFFFNGGIEIPNEGEDRVLIPSPKVATYDLKPEMSAIEVKNEAVNRINSEDYQLIILNFANSDMVGHTGIIPAAIKAVETVDTCLGELIEATQKHGYTVLVTADHGNSEQMIDEETGGPFTAHTTNPVPFIVIGEGDIKLEEGILADIAPTILDVMGLEQPAEMTGRSLITREE